MSDELPNKPLQTVLRLEKKLPSLRQTRQGKRRQDAPGTESSESASGDGKLLASPETSVTAAPLICLRSYQREVFRHQLRRLFLLWARQHGKSFTLACEALDLMMAEPGALVTFISASVALGTEILLKEVQIWVKFLALYREAATEAGLKFESNADGLAIDDVAEIFEHSKLETKLWHDRTTCSRSRVIAPNPDTAVGWTAHIIGDEVGRWPEAKDVCEAIFPFMRSNPKLKLRLATTPPPDDKHVTYEWFLPPDAEFPVKPKGNWYKAPCGIMTHRLDIYDGAEAGVITYHPDTGEPIAPEEDRRLSADRSAWDRNNALKFLAGGTSALSLAAIQRAMALGRGQCAGVNVTEAVILGEAA